MSLLFGVKVYLEVCLVWTKYFYEPNSIQTSNTDLSLKLQNMKVKWEIEMVTWGWILMFSTNKPTRWNFEMLEFWTTCLVKVITQSITQNVMGLILY